MAQPEHNGLNRHGIRRNGNDFKILSACVSCHKLKGVFSRPGNTGKRRRNGNILRSNAAYYGTPPAYYHINGGFAALDCGKVHLSEYSGLGIYINSDAGNGCFSRRAQNR